MTTKGNDASLVSSGDTPSLASHLSKLASEANPDGNSSKGLIKGLSSSPPSSTGSADSGRAPPPPPQPVTSGPPTGQVPGETTSSQDPEKPDHRLYVSGDLDIVTFNVTCEVGLTVWIGEDLYYRLTPRMWALFTQALAQERLRVESGQGDASQLAAHTEAMKRLDEWVARWCDRKALWRAFELAERGLLKASEPCITTEDMAVIFGDCESDAPGYYQRGTA